MKKVLILSAVIAMSIFSLVKTGTCLDKGNLYDIYNGKSVKVFILDITDSTKEKKIDLGDFKEKLKNALEARRGISFTVLNNEQDCDISISCSVLKYNWSQTDPIDMIFGAGAIAYDMATNDNYAYLEAEFIVKNVKKGRKIWKKRLKVDLTKPNMNEEQSLPLINEKTSKAFIKRCFSKRYSKKNVR